MTFLIETSVVYFGNLLKYIFIGAERLLLLLFPFDRMIAFFSKVV
jgi:hypothetical protein